MANQAGNDVVGGAASGPGQFAGATTHEDIAAVVPGALPDPGHSHASYHGKPASWVAVTLIIAGFLCGGLALVFGPTWVPFWIGAGLVVVGGLIAAATDIFNDWY
jgi:hypothetical protein